MIKSRVIFAPLVNTTAPEGKGKKAFVKHLQPGVVRYENEDGTFTTFLLELEGIAAMRPTAAGIPVVGKSGGFDHAQIEKGKKYDGVVLDSVWDGESGWEAFNVDEMNAETAKACEKGFQASCAYIPTETDGIPGLWHNVPYDEKILNGRYTHVAVVPNPRYEGATIELLNSLKGEVMNKVLKAALSLVPLPQLREVFNAIVEEDKKTVGAAAAKAEREKKNAEKVAKAKADYDAAIANAQSDEAKLEARTNFEKANADAQAAAEKAETDAAAAAAAPVGGEAPVESPKADLPPEPLGGGDVVPEPGTPGAEKKPPVAANEAPKTPPETPEQAQEREKKALEAKNAADAEAQKKLEEEKKNVSEAEAGQMWGAMTADEICEIVPQLSDMAACELNGNKMKPFATQPPEVKALWLAAYKDAHGNTAPEKQNSIKAKVKELKNAKATAKAKRLERFNSLRKLAEERGGASNSPFVGITSEQDKEDLGRDRYGSRA